MGKFIDRTGQVFNRLTVMERAGTTRSKKVSWLCLCSCGSTTIVDVCSLVTNNTGSCGCYLKSRITKHGCSSKASYNTWRAMIRRCNNIKDKDYPRYGARGITVCQEWHDYKVFVFDMGEPEGNRTLDRIDPYGNYGPKNCRWATLETQARNIRISSASKSGHIGVHKRGTKWYGELSLRGKTYYSKACGSILEAVEARKHLELIHWGSGI